MLEAREWEHSIEGAEEDTQHWYQGNVGKLIPEKAHMGEELPYAWDIPLPDWLSHLFLRGHPLLISPRKRTNADSDPDTDLTATSFLREPTPPSST